MSDLTFPLDEPIPGGMPSVFIEPAMCAQVALLVNTWLERLQNPEALIEDIESVRDNGTPLGDAVDALAGGGVLPAEHISTLNGAPVGLTVDVLNAAIGAAQANMPIALTLYEPTVDDAGARVTTWYTLRGAPVAWREIAVQVPRVAAQG